mmetsp:Transcript_1996/g.3546  ORF Transcript_1996/g.3546 Transcript_1996/m.3546 type:complete len:103 (+) Transcript_1996:167-475(+)
MGVSVHRNLREVSSCYDFENDTNSCIEIHVIKPNGKTLWFKLKRKCPLGLLFEVFYDKEGITPNQVIFSYNGQSVYPEQSPQQLEMPSIVTLDVYSNVTFKK